MSSIKHKSFLVLALFTLVAASCTTAGEQLGDRAADGLPFDSEDREQPVTEAQPEPAGGSTTTTTGLDPSVVGPTFDPEPAGATFAVSGDEGVWWLDANGDAQLVVEPAVVADYDGAGGLVFQRTPSSPIVRRTASAIESDLAEPGGGESLHLIGVAPVGGSNHAVLLRIADDGSTAMLERISLDDGTESSIAEMVVDGVAPSRLSISGGYVSGVYLSGSGAGWTTVSLSGGQRLFGTPQASRGACDVRSDGCAEAVTIGADGATVYQVAISKDSEGLDLVVNSSANFAEIARVDLQRPNGGWHPTLIEIVGSKIVVSRSVGVDGTGDLPPLIVDPNTGEITQLARFGRAVVVTG